ncbi:hypothetical protein RYZ26_09455 [Terasakiella sp. A23]|uniref:hypothetical protein n=1 Tax=Terasakiella sp. FCG-A23 TaxID=3080561 RepID=UPI0029537801|nr:hypothetical protein [Terasakiella sp. A23]MDV7339818.1 hypothetical protein [Terasakiella sp. A23]
MSASVQDLTIFVLESLGKLTAEELARLEEAVTPDVAYLLTKAFGAEVGVLTWPLVSTGEAC